MPKSYHPTLPARWNRLTLDCIVATGTPPPMAARILAIVHTCIYDAWAMYDDCALATRVAGLLRRSVAERTAEDSEAAVEAAISHAAYRALKEYFPAAVLKAKDPSKENLIEERMKGMGQDPLDAEENPATPVGLGKLIAQSVLDHRRGDGANTWQTLAVGKPYADYTGYQPALPPLPDPTVEPFESPQGPLQEHWQPLQLAGKAPQQFVAPHWGLVQPFALRTGAEFRPQVQPEQYYTVRFRQQCQDLIDLSAHLSDEHKAIAEYWMDGPGSVTPPGHWCLHAQWVAVRDQHDLQQDVKMFFALSNALMDAGIACWDCKRTYDYVRPVTAIRHLFRGQDICAWAWDDFAKGARLMKGEEWHPYQPLDFVTPPFSEYVSGHSTFSSAGAEILKRFTGSDYFGHDAEMLPGTSKIETDGKTPAYIVHLHWNTFSQAAAQAGKSRMYGGIHFEDGNAYGLALGPKVADKVWNKATRLWEGMYF